MSDDVSFLCALSCFIYVYKRIKNWYWAPTTRYKMRDWTDWKCGASNWNLACFIELLDMIKKVQHSTYQSRSSAIDGQNFFLKRRDIAVFLRIEIYFSEERESLPKIASERKKVQKMENRTDRCTCRNFEKIV